MTRFNAVENTDKLPLIYSAETLDYLARFKGFAYRYAGWTFTTSWAAMGLPREVTTYPLPEEMREMAIDVVKGIAPENYRSFSFTIGNSYALFSNGYFENLAHRCIVVDSRYLRLINTEQDIVFPVRYQNVTFLGVYRVISQAGKLNSQEQDITTHNYKMRAIISPRRGLV